MSVVEQPVFAVGTRGDREQVETIHRGCVSVVTGRGVEVASFGNSDASYPLRSTAKPLQVLPYLADLAGPETGDDDVAVMMSSHNAEDMHVNRVRTLLERHGLQEVALQCGAHSPIHEDTRTRMLLAGEAPSALHNNCSGKHASLLAVCKARGWDLDSYLDAGHPLQQRIRHIVAILSEHPEDAIEHSVDGCSLPTWWLPLHRLARLFADIAAPELAPTVDGLSVQPLLERVFRSGTGNPLLMSGSGRLDAKLMESFGGSVFAKTGASGMYAVAVRPTPDYPDGLGVAVKVEDGDHDSVVRFVVLRETLRQLGLLRTPDTDWLDSSIRNVRGSVVGQVSAEFELQRA